MVCHTPIRDVGSPSFESGMHPLSRCGAASRDGDSESVRRIATQLERLEPEAARYLAAFAYVLARVAHAVVFQGAGPCNQERRR